MKKILSTVLVGALIAGIAFAEMSFDYKGTAIIGARSKYLGNTTKDGKTPFSGAIKRTDAFDLGLKNDIAGVDMEFDIVNDVDSNNDTKGGYSAFKLDHFYGYLAFGLPVGNLQITSGKWDARWVSRIKGDGGELDGDYYEAFKPGVINGQVAKDVDNLTGSSNMSTVLAYTLNDVLPGTLMAKFGLVGEQGTPFKINGDNPITKGMTYAATTYYNEDGGDDVEIKAGFVGQIAYQQEDLIKLNVDFKTLKENAYAFGIFLSPLMVENLNATLGFSMGIWNPTDVADYTEWGVDVRLRYAISDKLAITTMHNISGYSLSPKTGDSSDSNAMWNMISASYVAGDNIRFLATIQNINSDFKASNPTANTFAITPACEIKAGEKAKVTTAFDIRWTGIAPYGGTGNITMPIYVNFSL